MGNAKKGTIEDIKEESRQLYDLLLLKFLQEEKTNVESKVQEEQLNARFMSFYHLSKNRSRRDDDNGRSAVALIDSLRSGKAPTFAAIGSNIWLQRAQSADKLACEFKAELERAKRAEDEIALLFESNPDLLFLKNTLEEWKRDFGVKLGRVLLEEDSSVSMWRDRSVSTAAKKFWKQFGRGDVMLGLRRGPLVYVEATCSQIDELSVTNDVKVQFVRTQFDQERAITLWRELVRESPAINSVLDRSSVTAKGRVVSEGGEYNVNFQIAMWGESGSDFNSAWKRLKNATLVSTSSNSGKSIVEVAVHQGVSISIEGFLFEANTHLPLSNNNAMLNNNGSPRITSDSIGWFRLSIENYKETHDDDIIQYLFGRLSQNTHSFENNNTTLKYDENSRRLCLDVTQVPDEVVQDCFASTAQRNVEPIEMFNTGVTHHHTDLQHYF